MSKTILALDVGEKRIGVAVADTGIKIAVPQNTVEVDGTEIQTIIEMILRHEVSTVVFGYPRNQAGEVTQQTAYVEAFAENFADVPAKVVFQDESLTSVLAEKQLEKQGRPYSKGDIDALAASIILEDYLELHT